jgi:hypothetical protein
MLRSVLLYPKDVKSTLSLYKHIVLLSVLLLKFIVLLSELIILLLDLKMMLDLLRRVLVAYKLIVFYVEFVQL